MGCYLFCTFEGVFYTFTKIYCDFKHIFFKENNKKMKYNHYYLTLRTISSHMWASGLFVCLSVSSLISVCLNAITILQRCAGRDVQNNGC